MHEYHNLQHLDVKPANLLLMGERCKISDFSTTTDFSPGASEVILKVQSEDDPGAGQTVRCRSLRELPLGKAVRRGATLFTVRGAISPYYAPPEAFAGRFSRSFDQYSLALCFCELVSGRLPFAAEGDAQIEQRFRGELSIGFLPGGLRPAMVRALSPRPEERFGSCMEFVRALYRGFSAEAHGRPS